MDAQPFCKKKKKDIVIIFFKLHLLSHTALIVGSILVCVLAHSTQHNERKSRDSG